MDTYEICPICFLYQSTGDATIFDGYTETSEEGDALMHHTQDSLNSFIGEHEILQWVHIDEVDEETFFSNRKCDCWGSLPGSRYLVTKTTIYDPDEEYAEAVLIESLSEIPTEIMQEVRCDQ